MDYNTALQFIQDVFDSMQRSGMISEDISLNKNTVILGADSALDSLGFVTFISDLEDRLCDKLDREVYLVLNEIGDFNVNNPFLSADTIAQYIENITQN